MPNKISQNIVLKNKAKYSVIGHSFGAPLPSRTYSISSTEKYKFGFNGKENINEVNIDGNCIDFGERIYNGSLGVFLSIDKHSAKGPQYSPFIFCFDNPISFVDPEGNWGVLAHYRMTKHALIHAGIDRKTAKEIAHLASTYADHPAGYVLRWNKVLGIVGLTNPNKLSYNVKKYGSYTKTENSQSDELIKSHSMHATKGSFEKISNDEAVKRALFGGSYVDQNGKEVKVTGAFEILDKYKGKDLAKLDIEAKKEIGVALHAIEDVFAHNGVTYSKDESKNKHSLNNDIFGDKHDVRLTMKDIVQEYFGKNDSDKKKVEKKEK